MTMVLTHPGVSYAQDDLGRLPGVCPQVVFSSKPGSHARQPGGVGAASARENNFTFELQAISRKLPIDKTEHLCYY